jgi:hypothetical protein
VTIITKYNFHLLSINNFYLNFSILQLFSCATNSSLGGFFFFSQPTPSCLPRQYKYYYTMPPATNPRGRKVGSSAGKKRKAPEEFSTNKNTKQARERIANMDAVTQEIKQAKAADTQA